MAPKTTDIMPRSRLNQLTHYGGQTGLLLLEALLILYFISMFPFGIVEWMYAAF